MRTFVAEALRRWVFGIVFILAAFTGFGNLPIYRRYYISDIPGFAWAGDFFANLYVHYTAGALLVALSVYVCLGFWMLRRRQARLTRSGWARAVALGLVFATGVIMLIKNLPGAMIPFPWVAVLTVGHMALSLVAVAVVALSAVKRWPWIVGG
jgi:membrane-associated PAP2 superfamily phosphatase